MTTRKLLSGPITLSIATGRTDNILDALQYPLRRAAFYDHIEGHRALLAEVIAHHLGTKPTDIDISPQEWWRHGSFNLCVPLKINVDCAPSNTPEYAFIRFPLPYRVGEASNPGNSDEKLNCEAATYAWLEENCPSVPIPKLYGFGLSTNERFTNASLLPRWSRWFYETRRFFLAAFGLQQPSQYVRHDSRRFAALDIGYLLIETITSGDTLSSSWDTKRDATRLQNLQGDLARIMVSLARIRLPRIGLLRLDSNGYLRLDNRPISVQSTIHENEGLSLHMSRRTTFSSVQDFVSSQLKTFETRFIEHPNAIDSPEDAWYQMASLAAAKVVFPQLFRDDLRNGPFVFSLTDLHRSNIFVDENWHITCIIDLEFACSWPIEFLQTPYWLGGKFVDEDQNIIATAIPRITDEFHSINDIGWYGSAYLLTTCSFQLLMGKVYKHYPAKPLFLAGVLFFEVGSAVCGAAPSSAAFIIGRAVAGFGASGLFSGLMVIMFHTIPLQQRPLWQGAAGAFAFARRLYGAYQT